MKYLLAAALCSLLSGMVRAADPAITPAMQASLDEEKKVVVSWAAEPILVAAVKEQNDRGPVAGMDNSKWSALEPGDPVVVAFERSPAAEWLAAKIRASDHFLTEAFLNAARGEKVAFVEKPTCYVHAGREKFDEPMKKSRVWQGEPELDASSKAYAIQLAAPVLDGSRPIGVLVVGVATEKLHAE